MGRIIYLILLCIFALQSLHAQRFNPQNYQLSNAQLNNAKPRLDQALGLLNSRQESGKNYSTAIELLKNALLTSPRPTGADRQTLDLLIIDAQEAWLKLSQKNEINAKEAQAKAEENEEKALAAEELAKENEALANTNGQAAEAGRLVLLSNDRLANGEAKEALHLSYMAIQLHDSTEVNTATWRSFGEAVNDETAELILDSETPILDAQLDRARQKVLLKYADKSLAIIDLAKKPYTIKSVLAPQSNLKAELLAQLNPDGTSIAYVLGQQVFLYSLKKQAPKLAYQHEGRIYDLKFSYDGKLMASSSEDGTVALMNTQNDKVEKLQHHQGKVYEIAFSTKRNLLASRGADQVLNLYLQDKLLKSQKAHPLFTSAISFSNSSGQLISIGDQGDVHLWDEQGQQTYALKRNSPTEKAILINQGNNLAVLNKENELSIFSIENGNANEEQQTSSITSIGQIKNSPLHFAAADGGLWYQMDGGDSQARIVFSGHQASVQSVDYLADEKLWLSTANDGTAKVWNNNREVALNISLNSTAPLAAFFSADKKGIFYFNRGNTQLKFTYLPQVFYTQLGDQVPNMDNTLIEKLRSKYKLLFYGLD